MEMKPLGAHTHTHTHTGQVSAGELIGQGAGHQGEAAHLLVCLFFFFSSFPPCSQIRLKHRAEI